MPNPLDDEKRLARKTTSVVAEVTERLKLLGLYDVKRDSRGKMVRADVDERQRRELLLFLSELEDLVGKLESHADNISSEIRTIDRSKSAVAAYRQTKVAYRAYQRQNNH